MPVAPWITRSKSQPRLRMFCFPYAGGGASIYRLWSKFLPLEVEVCPVHLPGRERKVNEPLFTHITPLIQALTQGLEPYMDIPFTFFGHSMGALISFEMARSLRRNGSRGPLHLFLSAHRAPHLPRRHAPISHLPESEFVQSVIGLGGTPLAVVQNAELMQLLLPLLRADFEITETYHYLAEPPFDCPITAFASEQDTAVSVQEVAAWNTQTQGPFSLNIMPGDHFFIHGSQNLLLQHLSQNLTTCLSQLI